MRVRDRELEEGGWWLVGRADTRGNFHVAKGGRGPPFLDRKKFPPPLSGQKFRASPPPPPSTFPSFFSFSSSHFHS